MKPDKVFILMLVILLPLTGCIDVSDNADAQDSSDSEEAETTVINNYYNTTEIHQTGPSAVITHYIEENQTLTLDFDGTFTYKVETIYRLAPSGVIIGGSEPSYWAPVIAVGGVDINCSGSLSMDSTQIQESRFLPVLPMTNCEVVIPAYTDYEFVIVFSNHTLAQ